MNNQLYFFQTHSGAGWMGYSYYVAAVANLGGIVGERLLVHFYVRGNCMRQRAKVASVGFAEPSVTELLAGS